MAVRRATAEDRWYAMRRVAFVALLSVGSILVSVATHGGPAAAWSIASIVIAIAVLGIHASQIIALFWQR